MNNHYVFNYTARSLFGLLLLLACTSSVFAESSHLASLRSDLNDEAFGVFVAGEDDYTTTVAAEISNGCGSNIKIDTYAKGLVGGSTSIDIPFPNNIIRALVEVWASRGDQDDCLDVSSIEIEGVQSTMLSIPIQAPDPSNSDSPVEKVFRTYITNIGNDGDIDIVIPGDCEASSVVVYVEREIEGGSSTVDLHDFELFWSHNIDNATHCRTVPIAIASSLQSRDINIKVPIHEKDNQKVVTTTVTVAGQTQTQSRNDANARNGAHVFSFDFLNVPANTSTASVEVCSPEDEGDSFGIGSVVSSTENSTSMLPSCPLVLITCSSDPLVSRTASNGDTDCNSTNYAFFLEGLTLPYIGDQDFTVQNGSFVENANGSARFTGSFVNNTNTNVSFDFDVVLRGRTYNPPAGSPKENSNCVGDIDNSDWYYYTSFDGTLTGTNDLAGGRLRFVPRGEAFQLGTGANLNQASTFGASAWFDLVILSQPNNGPGFSSNRVGDFNFNLSGSTPEDLPAECLIVCADESTTISANAIQGTPPYSFAWSSGQTTQNITVSPNSTTTYQVTVTDADGCSSSDDVVITVNNPNLFKEVMSDNTTTTCDGSCTGTILLDLHPAAVPGRFIVEYTYNGSVVQRPFTIQYGDLVLEGLCEGIYSDITVIDTENGCSSVWPDDIEILRFGEFNVFAYDQAICAGESAVLTATAVGGVAPYTYSWSNGLGSGANKTVNPLTTTTYTVTVSDNSGCTTTRQVTVNVDCSSTTCSSGSFSEPLLRWGMDNCVGDNSFDEFTAAVSQNSCSAVTNISLGSTYAARPGNEPIQDDYENMLHACGNGLICFFQDVYGNTYDEVQDAYDYVEFTLTPEDCGRIQAFEFRHDLFEFGYGDATQYYLRVKKDGEQIYLGIFDITSDGFQTDLIDFGLNSNFSIDAPTTFRFEFIMFNSSEGPSPWNMWEIDYISIYGGCSTSSSCNLSTVDAGTDQTICSDDNTTISASASGGVAPYTYTWNNGAGTGASVVVSPNTTTTYTVTATDANGCISTDDVVVTVKPEPVASFPNPGTTCEGDPISFVATNAGTGATYSWNFGPGATPATATGRTPSAVTYATAAGVQLAANVTLTVTLDGCEAETTQIFAIRPTPEVTITATTDPTTCEGTNGSFSVDVVLNGSFQISLDGGANWENCNQEVFTGLAAGTYDLQVRYCNGDCVTDVADVTLEDPATPVAAITGANDLCSGETLNFSTPDQGAGTTYSWNFGPNATPSTSSSRTPGPITFTTSANATDDVTATVSLTVTRNGCVATDEATLNIIDTPDGTLSADNATCGEDNGSVTITFSDNTNRIGVRISLNGGTPANINDAAGSYTFSNLAAGTYNVVIQWLDDACPVDLGNISVEQENGPSVTASNDASICIGDSRTLSATSTGGTSPVVYTWMPGNFTGATFPVTPAVTTTYTVTGTDANGCTSTDEVVVTVNPSPEVLCYFNVGNGWEQVCEMTVCEGTPVTLSAHPAINAGYSWTGPNGFTANTRDAFLTNSATPAMSGVYTVVYVDANGCTDSADLTLTVNPLPVLVCETNINNGGWNVDNDCAVTLCEGESLRLSVNPNVSTVSWTGPNGFTANGNDIDLGTLALNEAGNYTATLTNGNGCVGTTTIAVTVNSGLTSPGSIAGGATYCNSGDPGTISNSASAAGGSGGTIQYQWQVRSKNACAANWGAWSNVSNATGATYNPPSFSDDRQYRRGARRSSCGNWIYSNVVTFDIESPLTDAGTISGGGEFCGNISASAGSFGGPAASGGCGGAIEYQWDFRRKDTGCEGAWSQWYTWGGQTGQNVSNWGNTGGNDHEFRRRARRVGCGDWIYSNTILFDVNCEPEVLCYFDVGNGWEQVCEMTVCEGTPVFLSALPAINTGYSWTGPNGFSANTRNAFLTNSATPAMSGVYTVVYVDANGCTDSADLTLTVNSAAWDQVNLGQDVSACGDVCDGTIIVDPNLAVTGQFYVEYTFEGNVIRFPATGSINDANNTTIPNLCEGVYSNITIIGANTGCRAIWPEDVVISEPSAPTAAFPNPGTNCEGDPISFVATNAGTGATYSWNFGPGATPATATGRTPSAVTYATAAGVQLAANVTLTVTLDGCPATTSQSFAVRPTPEVSITATTDPTTCEGTNGSFSVDVVGAGGFTISLDGGTSWEACDQDVFTGLAAGTYDLQVRYCNGDCVTDVADVTLEDPATPVAAFLNPGATCEGDPISFVATDAGAGATYSWDFGPGATPATATGRTPSAVTYATAAGVQLAASVTLTVTLDGCPATTSRSFTIRPTPEVSITATSDPTTCEGTNGSFSVDVVRAGGFQISLDGGASWEACFQEVFTGLAAGTYDLQVRYCAGDCVTDVADVTLEDPATPVAAITGANDLCSGETLNFSTPDQGAGTTYAWDFGPNATPSTSSSRTPGPITFTTSANATDDVTATVSLTVTRNGCVATDEATLNIIDIPNGTLSADNATCGEDNGSVTITFPNNANRSWISFSLNGGTPANISDATGSYTFSNLAAGTYNVVIQWLDDACPVDLGNISVEQENGPSVTASNDASICIGDSRTLSATSTGGTSPVVYTWMPGNFTGATFPVTPAVTTTYTVTATDANGCTSTDEIVVTVSTPVNAGPDQRLCTEGQGAISLTATGDGPYLWSTGETTATISVSPSVTTTYRVNGGSSNIVQAEGFNAGNFQFINATNSFCGGSTTLFDGVDNAGCGSFHAVRVTSGVTWGIGYSLSGNNTITNVGLERRNDCCTDRAEGGVVQIYSAGSLVYQSDVLSGAGNDVLYATPRPNVTGDEIRYVFLNGANTNNGDNTLNFAEWIIEGGTSCPSFDEVTVSVGSSNPIDVSPNQRICAGSSATISAFQIGGTGTNTYTWNNGAGAGASVTVSPTTTTIYTVTATDENGCTSTDQVTVRVDAGVPVITRDVYSSSFCGGGSETLTVSPGSPGSSAYTYQWYSRTTEPGTCDDSTSGWTPVGTNSYSYSTGALTTTTYYKVVMSNACGSDVSCATMEVDNATTDITAINVGTCVDNRVDVTVDVSWTNAPGGEDLEVALGTDVQYVSAPAAGSSGSTTLTFNFPSDGRQGMSSYAAFGNLSCGDFDMVYDLPAPCDACAIRAPDYAIWSWGISEGWGVLDEVRFDYTFVNEGFAPDYATASVGMNSAGGPSGGINECISMTGLCNTEYQMNIVFEEPITNFTPVMFGDGTNGDWEISINGQPFNVNDWNLLGRAELNDAGTRFRYEFPDDTPLSAWLTLVDETIAVTSASFKFYPESTGSTNCPYEVFLYGSQFVDCCALSDLNATASPDETICAGSSTTLDASSTTGGVAPITYAWDNGAGAGASVVVSPTAATTYTVTATDANGCTSTDEVTVTVNSSAPIITGGLDDEFLCVSGSVGTFYISSASISDTYQWYSRTTEPGTCDDSTNGWTPVGTNFYGYNPGTVTTTTYYKVVISNACGTDVSCAKVVVDNIIADITAINVGTCVDNRVDVTVDVSWANAPGGEDIEVAMGTDVQYVPAPAAGSSGSTTLTFNFPSDGRQGMSSYAAFGNLSCGDFDMVYDLPAPCDACPIRAPDYAIWSWGISEGWGVLDEVRFDYTFVNEGFAPDYATTSVSMNSAGGPSGGITQCISMTGLCNTEYQMNIVFEEPITNFTPVMFGDGTNGDWEISINGQPFNVNDWNLLGRAELNDAGTRFRYEFPDDTPLSAWLTLVDESILVTSASFTFYPESTGSTNCPYELFLYGSQYVDCCEFTDLNATASPDEAICSGSSATLTASATGGDAPYTYTWDNGAGTGASVVVSPTAATTYTVTATDANGCTSTDEVIVTISNGPLTTITCDADPLISRTATNAVATCNSDDFSLYLGLLTRPYTEERYFSVQNGTFVENANGTARATGTFVNNLDPNVSFDFDIVLSGRTTAANFGSPVENTQCIGDIDNSDWYYYPSFSGVLTGTNDLVGARISITPRGPRFQVGTGANLHQADQFGAASWFDATVLSQTDNGPDFDITFNPNGAGDLIFSLSGAAPDHSPAECLVVCEGESTTISATSTSGALPYSFAWSSGQNTETITVSPIETTTYTVTVTDANGCTSTDDVEVVASRPRVSAGVDDDICVGSSTTLTAIGTWGAFPFTYAWDNGAGVGASITVSPAITTTYTVTMTDANGCTTTDEVIVTVKPTPEGTIVDQTVCLDDPATLTVTPTVGDANFTYAWSDGGGTSASATFSPTATTTYTVTITDANGCEGTATGTINVNPLPVAEAGNDETICLNDNVTLTASATAGNGSFSYAWSTTPAQTTASITVSPSVTTTYTVTVTDDNNCTDTDQVTVTVIPAPSVTAAANNATCGADNGSITFTFPDADNRSAIEFSIDGGATYLPQVADNIGSTTINDLAPNTYDLWARWGNNECPVDLPDVTISQENGPSVVASNDASICVGGTVNMTSSATGGTGTITYTWMPGNFTGANFDVSPAMTTTYTVTATDTNGCFSTDQVLVTVVEDPSLTIALDDDMVCEGGTISITATPANGLDCSAVVFEARLVGAASWTSAGTGLTTEVGPGLAAGTYEVRATYSCDGEGCDDITTAPTTFTITPDPTVSISINDDVLCIGESATLTSTTSGGINCGDVNWTLSTAAGVEVATATGATYATPTNLTAGDYEVVAAYACNGEACNPATSDIVAFTVKPTPAGTIVDQAVCLDDPATLTVTPTVGDANFTYAWSDGGGTSASATFSPTTTTTYTVTITDANGCEGIATGTINVNDLLAAAITGPAEICANENTVFSVTTPTPGATYAWVFDGPASQTNQTGNPVTVSYSAAGSYLIELTVTSGDNCVSVASTSVIVREPITADGGGNQEICQGGSIVLDGSNSIGTSYTWTVVSGDPTSIDGSTTSETLSASPLFPTVYRLTVRDATGICERVDDVTVNIDVDQNPIADAAVDFGDDLYCAGVTFTLDGSASQAPVTDPTATLNYLWYAGDPIGANFIGLGETLEQTASATTTYTLIVSADATGTTCSDTAMVTVNIVECASLGDYVWEDTNGNGINDEPASAGIDGVTVNLKDENGDVIETTMTMNGGFYEFTNLIPGTYSVQFELLDGFYFTGANAGAEDVDSDAAPSGPMQGMTETVDLEAGDNYTDLDAGVFRAASLGNLVWLDIDADGIYDPATESGIEGVTVSLTDENGNSVTDINGNPVVATTTDVDGLYEFTNLVPGDYIVVFGAPTGLASSPANQGGDDTVDSDAVGGQTGVINLISGENDDTNDAGFYGTTSLGDLVWNDLNADGIYDPATEPGIEGVTVSLTDENGNPVTDVNGNPVVSTTTDVNGEYEFIDLVPGDYIVVFGTPTGFEPSPANEGGDDTVDSDNVGGMTGVITLVSGDTDDTNDAGFFAPASLGNLVWLDIDADGIYDPATESGIEGVTVSLTDENGNPVTDVNGNPVVSTTTDVNGEYEFIDLVPGDYIVVFGTPTGFEPSPANEGGDDTVDSDNVGGMTGVITLVSGDTDDTNDAGFFAPASLGNLVWLDIDADGIYDPATESGIEGVTVSLTDENGNSVTDINGNPVVATTTDVDGLYEFTNLVPGDYIVVFGAPTGLASSPANQGGDDTVDSDAVGGQTGVINLISGENDDTNDAGYLPVVDLALTKVVNNATPNVGENVTFTITVTNGGPSDATGVVVTDELPTGYAFVSSNGAYDAVSGEWTIGNIANGGAATLEITATVLASGDYVNIASVTEQDQDDSDSTPNNDPDTDGDGNVGSEDDGDPNDTEDPDDEDDADDAETTPNAVVDLALTKVVNNATPNVGENVTFTITVTNGGPSNATGVVVTDELPTGYAFVSSNGAYDAVSGEWTIGNIANGGSATLEITATVLASGDYVNIASVTEQDQDDSDSTPNNDPDTDGDGNVGSEDDGDPNDTEDPDDEDDADDAETTPNAVVDLALTKVVNNATPNVGENVTFTVTVTNSGPSNATGVVVTDELPSGYAFVSSNGAYDAVSGEWTIGNIANGGSATLEITATVLASGDYVNIASVTEQDQDDSDSTPNNDPDTTETVMLVLRTTVIQTTPKTLMTKTMLTMQRPHRTR